MKRIIPLLLVALLAVMVLGGCAQDQEPNQNQNQDQTQDQGQDNEQRNVLRVGMECAYAPYNWSQPTDANGAVPIFGSSDFAFGYDVMMAKFVADKLGYDLEIHMIDWDSLPMAVQSGAIDIEIAGRSITAERQMSFDFSSPYYYASIVSLVMADGPFGDATGVSDLAGAVATSQLNTVWYDVVLPQVPDVDMRPAMESAPAMLVALTSGAVELVVTDFPTALAAVQVYPELKLLDFTDSDDAFEVSDEQINIGIMLAKGNTELLDKINEALSELTVADFERMMDEAIRVQPLAVD